MKRNVRQSNPIGILGAGAGGVATALKLAEEGYQIILIEKNLDILLGSSNATPGRAGLGFHYEDAKTGIFYQNSTLDMLCEFEGCTRGNVLPEDHYMRHGLYFIMKTKDKLNDQKFASLFSKDQILETYEKLREAYAKKIEENPKYKLFGEPEQFFVHRNLEDFKDVVKIENIEAVVDTREELLNWPKVRSILCKKVQEEKNITVYRSTLVERVTYDPTSLGFIIHTDRSNFKVDFVINSTWENIEFINNMLSLYTPKDSDHEKRTNRLKVIVKVKLPPSLNEKSSMFFCMGPHCMFSNMGDGTGMITYAPVTNMRISTDLCISRKMEACLSKKISHEEKMDLANKVILGAAEYIIGIENAEILDVGFGIIRTEGTVDVFDPKSDFHKRSDLCIKSQQIGWIDNPCMKLLHFPMNAKIIAELVHEHQGANQFINEITEEISKKSNLMDRRDVRRMLEINLQRNSSFDELRSRRSAIIDDLESVMTWKSEVMNQIKREVSKISHYKPTSYVHWPNMWKWVDQPGKIFMIVMGLFACLCWNRTKENISSPIQFWQQRNANSNGGFSEKKISPSNSL